MTYKPSQKRGAKGTDLGGEFIGVKSVARALIKMMSPHEAAQHDADVKARTPVGRPAIARLMAAPSAAHKKMASHDRARASRLHDQIRTLDEQHAAPQFDGSRLSHPEARRQNRLQAERLRAELAPIQRRVDVADAIAADHRETHGAAPTPDASLLEAARAHVAAMQGGAPAHVTPSRPERLSADPAVRAVQVDNRVRAAYADLAANPGDWVGLADLRNHLGEDVNRHEVDASLKRLEQEPGANIVPESNQKMLTQADRDAAVVIGDQAKHAIMLQDPSPRPVPTVKAPPAKKTAARKLTAGQTSGMSAEEIQQAHAEGRVSAGVAAKRLREYAAFNRSHAAIRSGSWQDKPSEESTQAAQGMRDRADALERIAAEIEAKPVKKTAAAKMTRAKASVDHASIADQVKAAQSEDDVRALLQGQKLTVADLKTIAGHVGGPAATPKGTKQQIIDKIAAGSAGLKNRPASIFAGDWNRGTASAPSMPTTPNAPDAAELERRRQILAAPLAQPRAMRPEDGIGVFSANPETQRQAAAALDAATPDIVLGTPVTVRNGDTVLFGSMPSRVGQEAPATPQRKVDVENAIRQAYRSSGRSPSGWASLADVRDQLGSGYSRQEVDDALARMSRQQGADRIVLTPEANQKTLTPRTRSAAVILGNQDKHAVLIQDASPRPGGSTSASSAAPKRSAAQKMTRRRAASA
jgi:hypothetical protein